MRCCIFCGSTKKLTAEHLFGDWVSWAFHPSRVPKQYKLFHRNLEGRERRWVSSSMNQKTRMMCAACNNEWFSDLEALVNRTLLRAES
jgi:hypothetical protein